MKIAYLNENTMVLLCSHIFDKFVMHYVTMLLKFSTEHFFYLVVCVYYCKILRKKNLIILYYVWINLLSKPKFNPRNCIKFSDKLFLLGIKNK